MTLFILLLYRMFMTKFILSAIARVMAVQHEIPGEL